MPCCHLTIGYTVARDSRIRKEQNLNQRNVLYAVFFESTVFFPPIESVEWGVSCIASEMKGTHGSPIRKGKIPECHSYVKPTILELIFSVSFIKKTLLLGEIMW